MLTEGIFIVLFSFLSQASVNAMHTNMMGYNNPMPMPMGPMHHHHHMQAPPCDPMMMGQPLPQQQQPMDPYYQQNGDLQGSMYGYQSGYNSNSNWGNQGPVETPSFPDSSGKPKVKHSISTCHKVSVVHDRPKRKRYSEDDADYDDDDGDKSSENKKRIEEDVDVDKVERKKRRMPKVDRTIVIKPLDDDSKLKKEQPENKSELPPLPMIGDQNILNDATQPNFVVKQEDDRLRRELRDCKDELGRLKIKQIEREDDDDLRKKSKTKKTDSDDYDDDVTEKTKKKKKKDDDDSEDSEEIEDEKEKKKKKPSLWERLKGKFSKKGKKGKKDKKEDDEEEKEKEDIESEGEESEKEKENKKGKKKKGLSKEAKTALAVGGGTAAAVAVPAIIGALLASKKSGDAEKAGILSKLFGKKEPKAEDSGDDKPKEEKDFFGSLLQKIGVGKKKDTEKVEDMVKEEPVRQQDPAFASAQQAAVIGHQQQPIVPSTSTPVVIVQAPPLAPPNQSPIIQAPPAPINQQQSHPPSYPPPPTPPQPKSLLDPTLKISNTGDLAKLTGASIIGAQNVNPVVVNPSAAH